MTYLVEMINRDGVSTFKKKEWERDYATIHRPNIKYENGIRILVDEVFVFQGELDGVKVFEYKFDYVRDMVKLR